MIISLNVSKKLYSQLFFMLTHEYWTIDKHHAIKIKVSYFFNLTLKYKIEN